ncbi:MAG: FMN-binding protein [Planctomycetota bacterium]|jgi:electron transport complex protein RnfG
MTDVDLTISAGRPEPSSFRLVATLAAAAFCSGFVLAGVYQVTKPIIDANKAEALRLGVFTVVPGASRIQKLVLRDGALVPAADGEITTEPTVHAAYDDDGTFLGWAISGAGPGFQDTIGVLYGYDPTVRQVTGMHILQSKETPGLGDKIFKDEDFVGNFNGLAIDPEIVVVKDGRDADNEVDAITGATISSKAVCRIINEANTRWLDLLPPPQDVPPPSEPPPTPAAEGPEP